MYSPPPHFADTETWRRTFLLSFQSLGVVFGHLSIGPLYVFNTVSPSDMTSDSLFGILSFIIWTMTLIPLVKYVFIVLKAHDNGEGGTFALYSLLCRHAKVGLLPNNCDADDELLAYEMGSFYKNNWDTKHKRTIEKSKQSRYLMLMVALLGSCMVIGNGVLVPAISVFSASLGLDDSLASISFKTTGHHSEAQFEKYAPVPTACVILVALFVLQHFGTQKIGFLFAPIIIVWLLFLCGISVYNVFHWNYSVLYAVSPTYLFKYLRNIDIRSWRSLGGVVLSIAGSDAMFADLGHFSTRSIKIAFSLLVYPSLVLCYMGQTAFISKNWDPSRKVLPSHLVASMPGGTKHIFTVLSVLASVVGSQAAITATFSIINQLQALNCFPRVKVVHTSERIHGQIYIPDINWILMALCLAFTIAVKDVANMGNATGIAVVIGMLITTCFMSLIVGLYWGKVFEATIFLVFFGFVEAVYLLACILNFQKSAWVFLFFIHFVLIIMLAWHYGTMKKYEFDVNNKVSIEWLTNLGPGLGVVRLPGIGFVYSDIMTGIPAFFSHFVTNLPAYHEVLVFVSFKPVPVPFVPPSKQYIIGRMGSKEFKVYRCIVRYGYCDSIGDVNMFEDHIFRAIGEFVSLEDRDPVPPNLPEDRLIVTGNLDQEGTAFIMVSDNTSIDNSSNQVDEESPRTGSEHSQILPSMTRRRKVRFLLPPDSPQMRPSVRGELLELVEAREHGMTYILGQSHIFAHQRSNFLRRLAIKLYIFLGHNCRDPSMVLNIPHAAFVEVGMPYYL
ncbi:putative potassium transporter [Dioscorea sansibarensis]